MSGKRVKFIARQVKKHKDKIRMDFLKSIESEKLGIRFKVACKILFSWTPPWRKNKSGVKNEKDNS